MPKIQLRQAVQRFFTRKERSGTSPFGIVLQLAGFGGILGAIYALSPLLAMAFGGIVLIIMGEKL
jgi:hypothetical protein